MNSCKKFSEKLVFFESLTPAEKSEVTKHTEQCVECKSQLEKYQLITTHLKKLHSDNHIDDNLLVRYSLYLSEPNSSDYDGRKLSRQELQLTETHLSECKKCNDKVQELKQEYENIVEFLESTELPPLMLGETSIKPAIGDMIGNHLKVARNNFAQSLELLKSKLSEPWPKFYPMVAGAVALFLVFIWFGPFFQSDNPYLPLTAIHSENLSFLTRSGLPNALAKGLSEFRVGKYGEAILSLNNFIENNTEPSSEFYAHYLLGICYLAQSKKTFLGRVYRIEADQVRKGIRHLQTAKMLSDNIGFNEDCDWYITKGYLLLNNTVQAKETLANIREMRGRKFKEAQTLLEEIEKIE